MLYVAKTGTKRAVNGQSPTASSRPTPAVKRYKVTLLTEVTALRHTSAVSFLPMKLEFPTRMALENVFGYLGLSALCGYEELNEDKRLLPDGATLLDRSRFTYGGAIHSSVELFLTDNLLFVLKAQGRLLFGSDLHRFRPAISAGLKFNI